MESEHDEPRFWRLRWISTGLGTVCLGGLIGLLGAQRWTWHLTVASVGFVVGLIASLGLLGVWMDFESGQKKPSPRPFIRGDLFLAAIGTGVGVFFVAWHLSVAAVVGAAAALIAIGASEALRQASSASSPSS
jgi:hypothetical protein